MSLIKFQPPFHGIIVLLSVSSLAAAGEVPSGNAVVRARAGRTEIVITTTARLAGAIHSVQWNDKEFIDS